MRFLKRLFNMETYWGLYLVLAVTAGISLFASPVAYSLLGPASAEFTLGIGAWAVGILFLMSILVLWTKGAVTNPTVLTIAFAVLAVSHFALTFFGITDYPILTTIGLSGILGTWGIRSIARRITNLTNRG